ncbi:putative leucine-rich repeat receptor-like protein kinase [Acorus calamus]|uniref:non-specific serine/threonine protein kinase n=1 Tax=Acorus calamus TaxID=4465 RepID=A0AAV9EVU0_ACOCL|nr:putative leucine-rich repeat receptor-like protein kinase [Acorus calamus]
MLRSLLAIIGGAAGGLVLVALVVGVVWFCMLHHKSIPNKNSETASSDPSALVEWNRGGRFSTAGCSYVTEPQGARQFALEELEQATKNFSEHNLIGKGRFGLVYKGMLCDGTIVATKMRPGAPRQDFVEEVHYLSGMRHRNLVNLLGYCQEGGLQMLVYEYLPNGSVCNHLYDNGRESTKRLEFKQRLSIALGAAKGLCHLHSMVPPLVHKDFKTSNVLVDENFISKVADAGVIRILQRMEDAFPSSQAYGGNVFQDPVVAGPEMLSVTSDIYSFGVFLLELITGRKASCLGFLESGESLIHWVEGHAGAQDLIDQRLGNSFTSGGMKHLVELTLQCLSLHESRPKMQIVVSELDRILETEMTLTTIMGDGTAIVTLGSQLFTSS